MTKSRDLANAATALNAVTAAELGYVDGVTSAIQTQLDAKLASSTAATTYVANALADAKGDIFVASADNTVTRLPVGSTGDTIVADSSTSTGLRYQGNFAAGKNKVLNGAFDVWQRGSTVNLSTSTNAFLADRFQCLVTFSAGTGSISRQTFTPGTAPVAGYEGQYFQRLNTATTATYIEILQKIEDVRTLAGQNVTISFWAKASSAVTVKNLIRQNFGSGGSANVDNTANFNLTTSWQRFSRTIEPLGSLSGKTIGTNSYLGFFLYQDTGALGGLDIDLWGVQLEAGSVASAFQTATGTLQGELAACQRYYEKSYAQATAPGTATFTGCIDKYIGVTVTGSGDQIYYRVTKRGAVTVTIYSASTGTSGKVWSNSLGADQTITSGANGESAYSFYWSQTSAGLNVSYHFVASSEL